MEESCNHNNKRQASATQTQEQCRKFNPREKDRQADNCRRKKRTLRSRREKRTCYEPERFESINSYQEKGNTV